MNEKQKKAIEICWHCWIIEYQNWMSELLRHFLESPLKKMIDILAKIWACQKYPFHEKRVTTKIKSLSSQPQVNRILRKITFILGKINIHTLTFFYIRKAFRELLIVLRKVFFVMSESNIVSSTSAMAKLSPLVQYFFCSQVLNGMKIDIDNCFFRSSQFYFFVSETSAKKAKLFAVWEMRKKSSIPKSIRAMEIKYFSTFKVQSIAVSSYVDVQNFAIFQRNCLINFVRWWDFMHLPRVHAV